MEKKVLCVGLVCLDIIAECQSYPIEDTDQRIAELNYRRGGNASNSSSVLAQLGAKAEFLGNISRKSQHLDFLQQDFSKHGVVIDQCPVLPDEEALPTSLIISNCFNGSRTILHHPANLPELDWRHIGSFDLQNYSWIHFEGRSNNVKNIIKMIDDVRAKSAALTVSIEIEKPRPVLQELIALGDVVFISKEFAQFSGVSSKEEAVRHFMPMVKPGAIIVCAWGADGAATGINGQCFSQDAFQPGCIVDTLGAGDTFNAAFIYGRLNAMDVQKTLQFACYVAGHKVGQKGFQGIGAIKLDYESIFGTF